MKSCGWFAFTLPAWRPGWKRGLGAEKSERGVFRLLFIGSYLRPLPMKAPLQSRPVSAARLFP